MRIVFMGSPKEVISPLESLMELCESDSFELVAVISQPARPLEEKSTYRSSFSYLCKRKGIPTYPTKNVEMMLF